MADLSWHPRLSLLGKLSSGKEAVAVIVAVLLSLGLCSSLFSSSVEGAIRVWVASPTFNHCFLILPISMFLIWQRHDSLRGTTFEPNVFFVLAILPLSGSWLITYIAGVLEAQQFIVITIVQAILVATLGTAVYRKLAAPLLYLYFLVPSGAYLVPTLQTFTARFAVAGLHLLGIPVFSNGAVIEIPAGVFAVAEACAGLRFLVAAVAFGTFFAVITYRSWTRRAVFVALSVLIPIVANGFRALGLIAAAQWIGNPAAALADHILYGWIFFSIVLIILIVIGQRFSDQSPEINTGTNKSTQSRFKPEFRPVAVAGACVLCAAAGPVIGSFLANVKPVALPNAAPGVTFPWKETAPEKNWRPIVAPGSRQFLQTFSNGTDRIDRFIAVYRLQTSNNLISSNNRDADERAWSFDSAHTTQLVVDRRLVPARMSHWVRGSTQRTVWSFFVVDGRVLSNLWLVKWEQFKAYTAGKTCLSAYVALSIEGPDNPDSPGPLETLLSSQGSFRNYLCGSTTVRARQ